MVTEQSTDRHQPHLPLAVSDEAVTATYVGSLSDGVTSRQVREILELGSPVVVADELDRIAAIAHDTAQSFATAQLSVRRDDYLTLARILKDRALDLRGGA